MWSNMRINGKKKTRENQMHEHDAPESDVVGTKDDQVPDKMGQK
jgi:hypothetical protein